MQEDFKLKTHLHGFGWPDLQCTEDTDVPLSPAEICTHIQGAGLIIPTDRKEARKEVRTKRRNALLDSYRLLGRFL